MAPASLVCALTEAKKATASAMAASCSLTNQRPERMAPMRLMSQGAAHVADSSRVTEARRMREMWALLKPRVSRYVVICEAKLSTVR